MTTQPLESDRSNALFFQLGAFWLSKHEDLKLRGLIIGF